MFILTQTKANNSKSGVKVQLLVAVLSSDIPKRLLKHTYVLQINVILYSHVCRVAYMYMYNIFNNSFVKISSLNSLLHDSIEKPAKCFSMLWKRLKMLIKRYSNVMLFAHFKTQIFFAHHA